MVFCVEFLVLQMDTTKVKDLQRKEVCLSCEGRKGTQFWVLAQEWTWQDQSGTETRS